MTYLLSILMGIIQGVAEFLPISSSGHLALFQTFFGMENVEEKYMFFTVLLHFGTLISVCVVYWRDIVDMIREFFLGIAALAGKDTGTPPPPARRMVMLIIIGTLPLFVMVLLQDAVNALFSNSIMVSIALLCTGFILFFSDRLAKGRKTARNATVADALIVGCGQALAVIPGLSRSGTTISVGMLRGFDRSFAVRFSFLLSLPAILGANVLEIKDAVDAGINMEEMPMYIVGVVVAAVVGYFAIRLVKSLSDKGKFGRFAYYCWAVGLGSLIAGIIKTAMAA
ncbi:undecaprenyl-diphosphate phosphatase [Intestinimonas massiliensis (ex Afouda et al. 2020)]|uniref:undecaprenyl-diphosphate phosphatase n=1 Tax=Intestinimonas massiliensis (ex Afouda et al. 2020) TaxID=1673721 RepID=UPI001F5F6299|nr:undecaprenyl-diphosphate phosphatase [Intestinimonas massiliensis (ex Afouda et al. 2020)]